MSKSSGNRYTYKVTDLKTGTEYEGLKVADIGTMAGVAPKTIQMNFRYKGDKYEMYGLRIERTRKLPNPPKPRECLGVVRKKLAIYKGEELAGEFMAGDAMDYLGCGEMPIRRALDKGGHFSLGFYLEPREDVRIRYSRRCKRCGARVVNRLATDYCDRCREENRAEGIKRRKAAEAESRPAGVPVKKKSDLSRIAWEARQHGMSYGQYVGRGL